MLREPEWDDAQVSEELLGVAAAAYEKKTGREWDHETHVSYETGSNREAWGSKRPAQDRGWDGWVLVRSRARTATGEIDTVRQWRIGDPSAACAAHLALEEARGDRDDVRIIDHLKRSSTVSNGILAAPVSWVRMPVVDQT
jgi:hypothetical protein